LCDLSSSQHNTGEHVETRNQWGESLKFLDGVPFRTVVNLEETSRTKVSGVGLVVEGSDVSKTIFARLRPRSPVARPRQTPQVSKFTRLVKLF